MPDKIYSACWVTEDHGLLCGGASEFCGNNTTGGYGLSVYSCADNYFSCTSTGGQGCYAHSYQCDTPCGSSGSSECPAECRAGSSCGAGYSEASGCSGNGPGGACKSTQVCCAANSCGSGGGGGLNCSCGQQITTVCQKAQIFCNGAVWGDCTASSQPSVLKIFCDHISCIDLCPVCSTTSPTNLVVSQNSPTSATVTWTPGTGGDSQAIYVGPTESIVHANCNVVGEDCIIKDGLGVADTSYATGNVLQAGTVYFYKVVNVNGTIANCSSGTDTVTTLSSCSLSPSVLSLSPSDTAILTAVVNASTEIERVDLVYAPAGSVTLGSVQADRL